MPVSTDEEPKCNEMPTVNTSSTALLTQNGPGLAEQESEHEETSGTPPGETHGDSAPGVSSLAQAMANEASVADAITMKPVSTALTSRHNVRVTAARYPRT